MRTEEDNIPTKWLLQWCCSSLTIEWLLTFTLRVILIFSHCLNKIDCVIAENKYMYIYMRYIIRLFYIFERQEPLVCVFLMFSYIYHKSNKNRKVWHSVMWQNTFRLFSAVTEYVGIVHGILRRYSRHRGVVLVRVISTLVVSDL